MIPHKISYLILSILFLSLNAFAESPDIRSYDDFPQTGVLAANGSLPGGSLAIPQLPMGMLGQPIPLLGSLSLNASKQWVFGVKNNTDQSIKVQVEVVQFDINRSRISNSKYQYKLKPGAVGEGKSASLANSIGCAVVLKSWSWIK